MAEQSRDRDADEMPVKYYFVEDVESMSCYRTGGYHPVAIGDHLDGRYQVVHKLGHGSYSTVWLAWDDRTFCNVAIKIACADHERPRESVILSVLHEHVGGEDDNLRVGRASIAGMLGQFEIAGPNGAHHCLVAPAARFSMDDIREPGEEHPLSTVRAVVAQVTQAVAFLHSKGVVHGDLTLGNILLDLPETIKRMPPDQLYEEYGEPILHEIKRIDKQSLDPGVPQYGVEPAIFAFESEDILLKEAKVFLSDFGESYQPSLTPRTVSRAPGIYKPPEQFLIPDHEISFESDIWALGCVIFAMLGYRHFADGLSGAKNEVLREQVDALGPFPIELWEAWTDRGKHFNEDVSRKNGQPRRPLHERLMYSIVKPRGSRPEGKPEEDEVRALEDLLRSMFAVKVDDRFTAQQVLESEWMAKWALPDLELAQELWKKDDGETQDALLTTDDVAKEQEDASNPMEESEGGGREAVESKANQDRTAPRESAKVVREEASQKNEQEDSTLMDGSDPSSDDQQGGTEVAQEGGAAKPSSKDRHDRGEEDLEHSG